MPGNYGIAIFAREGSYGDPSFIFFLVTCDSGRKQCSKNFERKEE